MVIDKHITFADLKGTLEEFAKELFGPETKTKFRPIISRLQSPALRWTYPASNAEAKDAVSAKAPAGSRSWDAVPFIPTC